MKKEKSSPHRKELRALVVQWLYGEEFESQQLNSLKESYIFSSKEQRFLMEDFVQHRLKNIKKNKEKLDRVITGYSKNWKKERMSLIDLNIMRLALFEIAFCEDIPNKVALDEAIELSKKFGDDNSYRFINGILNQVLQDDQNLDLLRN